MVFSRMLLKADRGVLLRDLKAKSVITEFPWLDDQRLFFLRTHNRSGTLFSATVALL